MHYNVGNLNNVTTKFHICDSFKLIIKIFRIIKSNRIILNINDSP